VNTSARREYVVGHNEARRQVPGNATPELRDTRRRLSAGTTRGQASAIVRIVTTTREVEH